MKATLQNHRFADTGHREYNISMRSPNFWANRHPHHAGNRERNKLHHCPPHSRVSKLSIGNTVDIAGTAALAELYGAEMRIVIPANAPENVTDQAIQDLITLRSSGSKVQFVWDFNPPEGGLAIRLLPGADRDGAAFEQVNAVLSGLGRYANG
jgi:hypothetical protein